MTIVIGQRSQDLTKEKHKLNLSSNPEADLIRELLKIGLRLWCLCCISSRRWAGFSEHCYQIVALPGTLSMLLNTRLSIFHMPPLLPSFNGHLKCGFTPILAQPAQKSMRLPALSSLQLSGFSTRMQAWVVGETETREDREGQGSQLQQMKPPALWSPNPSLLLCLSACPQGQVVGSTLSSGQSRMAMECTEGPQPVFCRCRKLCTVLFTASSRVTRGR